MPIRLHDVATVHEYSPMEGVVLRYRINTNRDAMRSRIETRTPEGRIDFANADALLIARCIVGVEGVLQADGSPLVWPAIDDPKTVDANLAARVAILDAMPEEFLVGLKMAARQTMDKAAESGKG